MLYSADFETTTDPNDCRVWAWGVCEIGKPDNFHYGNSIESFIGFCEKSENSTFYFHNEKFDGEYLISYLLNHDYKLTKGKELKESKTFNTLISDMGLFYSIEIVFERKGRSLNRVKILDSLKVIPFSVDDVAKTFGLPINKLKIDYKEERGINHKITAHELNYLKHDVVICAMALDEMFKLGLDKMTIGKNALEDYRDTIGKREFDRLFPRPGKTMDFDLRQCYRGGFTYCMDDYKGINILEGIVGDVNSLYPWAMRECLLPYGSPVPFEGKYEYDESFPLYIQMIECQFELKKDHIPTIQIKDGDYPYPKNEYLKTNRYTTKDGIEVDEPVVMCLTSVDLELFLEHYDTFNLEYLKGWKFRGSKDMFKPYVDKWTKVKIKATEDGNKGLRTIAKLMLNSLYGKFAAKIVGASKYPYLKDGVVKYKTGELEERKAIYIPVAAFVTAWARHKTITTAQKLYKYFVYADTDSVHLNIPLPDAIKKMSQKEFEHLTTKQLREYGLDLPEDFEVDPTALGAWKLENKFYRARFLRQKSYIEDSNDPSVWNMPRFSTKLVKQFCEDMGIDFDKEIIKYKGLYDVDLFKITCAGMPSRCHPYVTWKNFHIGSSFKGKLKPSHVVGGIILEDETFTIKPA